MSKHTPGPWKAVQYKTGFTYIVAEHDAHICRMGSENQLADDSSAASNAALIASSPDLLETLKAVLDRATMPGFLIDRVKAAINKAEGGNA
jgi:hypothetical protein